MPNEQTNPNLNQNQPITPAPKPQPQAVNPAPQQVVPAKNVTPQPNAGYQQYQPTSAKPPTTSQGELLGYQQKYFPNQKVPTSQPVQSVQTQSPQVPQQQVNATQAVSSNQPQQPSTNPQVQQQPQIQQQPQQSPINPQQTVRPNPAFQPGRNPNLIARKPPDPKKVIYGCLSFFGCSIFFFVLFVIIFVSQTSATGENGLARALGLDPVSFTNSLILLTNLVFGLFAITTFTMSMVGLFRYIMTRKDDKVSRSKALSLAGVGALIFLIIVLIWVTVYIYLSGKKVNVARNSQVQGIVTEPVNTRLLTAPIEIKFDGTKIPNNNNQTEILSYLWDFGDGKTSTNPVVMHTYFDQGSNNGEFNVILTVNKRDKKTNENFPETYNTVVTIANVQLFASFLADPEKGPAPLTVNFDASASKAPAGEITEYAWDFQGNNTFRDAQGVKVSHTFEQEGQYKVSLRVTDNTGQKPAIITKTITVEGPNTPTAVIEVPTDSGKYFSGKQYSFYSEKSTSPTGKINKYEWNFGDGSPEANTRTATHTYAKAGEYEVILTVTDEEGKTGEASQKLKIETPESAPTAVIDSVPQMSKPTDGFITGTVPLEVAFSGTNSKDPDNNIIEYKWDFDGDNQIDQAGQQAKYVYKTAGVYNASLIVVDAGGNESKGVLVVKVTAQDLKAQVSAQPVDGVTPLTVDFDASGSSYPDGKIVSYEWDFGDGTPKRIDVAQVSFKYTKIGTFKATVTAKSSDGKSSTASIDINVRPPALTSCFKPSIEQGPAPLIVEFDPRCTAGPAAKYSWDFGDGETSRTRKPTHTYQKPGSYQVTLEVADNQNVVNTFSMNVLVTGDVQ
jgi:PKD repeat protein